MTQWKSFSIYLQRIFPRAKNSILVGSEWGKFIQGIWSGKIFAIFLLYICKLLCCCFSLIPLQKNVCNYVLNYENVAVSSILYMVYILVGNSESVAHVCRKTGEKKNTFRLLSMYTNIVNRLPYSLHMWAAISELPSNVSTMLLYENFRGSSNLKI